MGTIVDQGLCENCGLNQHLEDSIFCAECFAEWESEMCWQEKVAQAERDYQDAVLNENGYDYYEEY